MKNIFYVFDYDPPNLEFQILKISFSIKSLLRKKNLSDYFYNSFLRITTSFPRLIFNSKSASRKLKEISKRTIVSTYYHNKLVVTTDIFFTFKKNMLCIM
jgi:hypothetical protein